MTTKKERQELSIALAKKFDSWKNTTDEELFLQAKTIFPIISDATRAECIKFIVMDHVNKMI